MMNYKLLPPGLRSGMRRYVANGIVPGSFLVAVLENNLMEAFKCADEDNTRSMAEIVGFVYNELPTACHGSREKVKDWANDRQSENQLAEETDTNAEAVLKAQAEALSEEEPCPKN